MPVSMTKLFVLFTTFGLKHERLVITEKLERVIRRGWQKNVAVLNRTSLNASRILEFIAAESKVNCPWPGHQK